MSHIEIENSPIPIRLFKSNFFEFFTHISPLAIVIIYTPVVVYFIAQALLIRVSYPGIVVIPLLFILGLFVWTLSEYSLHRFVFHFKPRNPFQERVSFLMHGVHHKQPRCKTRLVMPPVLGIPLALVFWGLFTLIFGSLLGLPNWVAPSYSGFITGYLIYDLTHYATHHFPIRSRYYRFIKKYHMDHHYKTPDARFGVSSPIWDSVFGTFPSDEK
jgi:sterol desaturase/sphingolipid hydroxylase (fatty acid hydroxylase superfamily)